MSEPIPRPQILQIRPLCTIGSSAYHQSTLKLWISVGIGSGKGAESTPEAARIDATGGATEVQASGSNHAAGLGLGHGALGLYEDQIYSGLEELNVRV